MVPDEPYVWIVLIVTIGAVLALIIWLGRDFEFSKDKEGNFRGHLKGTAEKHEGINVAEGAEIIDAKIKDIAGVKIEGGSSDAEFNGKIDVFSGGKIKNAHVDDIVGVKKKGN